MTNTALKAQIDSQITNETTPNGITPTEVGSNLKEIVDYCKPYDIYCAEISQTGTNAPTVNVFQNTIGITPVWSRLATGEYLCLFTGESVNTWMIPNDFCKSAGGTNKVDISISTTGGNTLKIQSYMNDINTDGLLNGFVIELRKYL